MNLLFLDTETTGFDYQHGGIVEIGLVLYDTDYDTILDSYGSLHDPGVPIEPEAVAVHGITDAIVKGHKINTDLVLELAATADYLVAHNANFDRLFIEHALLPDRAELTYQKWLCTQRLIDWSAVFPNSSCRKLNHLAADMNLLNPFQHRAIFDAALLVEVAKPHLNEMIGNGTIPWQVFRAIRAPFETKDDLKANGYSPLYKHGKFQHWYKELPAKDEMVDAEHAFLETVYQTTDRKDYFLQIDNIDHWTQLPSAQM